MNEKVLIVDDEKSILDVLTYALKKEGYCVERAYDGEEAMDKAESFKPHIVILDLMMPVMNGYEVCRKLEDKNVGVIMLTAKDDIVDKVLGLELGADDYLTKPFDIRELLARVKSLSRRFKKEEQKSHFVEEIKIGDFIMNSRQRSVLISGDELELTTKEFELLYLFVSNPKLVYTRGQLLNLIWNMDYFGGTRTVDTHIQRIRKKLGEKYQNLIVTVYGVGYKGVGDVDEGEHQS